VAGLRAVATVWPAYVQPTKQQPMIHHCDTAWPNDALLGRDNWPARAGAKPW
jgi:hypothetical protein